MPSVDAELLLISDLHHSQTREEAVSSLLPAIQLTGAKKILGLGDWINRNIGEEGPYTSNISDLVSATNGTEVKSVAADHDWAGATNFYVDGAAIFPGERWTWDVGEKWRILATDTATGLGWILADEDLAWLENQLDQARTDNRYVVFATHQQLGIDIASSHDQILTPSGTTGTVTITASAPGAFCVPINSALFLRHGTCSDQSCWGWGKMIAVAGDGLSATITVENDFVSTAPADYWNFLYQEHCFYNSQQIRSILEQYDDIVRLSLSGHEHVNRLRVVNGIPYISMEAATSAVGEGGAARTGGMLYLYSDGTWKLRGSGLQTSYNWTEFYVNTATGDDTIHGGAFASDAWGTITKAQSSLPIGATLKVVGNVPGISFVGESERRITVTPTDGRAVVNGMISGLYLNISYFDISLGNILSASNSTLSLCRSI